MLITFYQTKNHSKIFQFITFYKKKIIGAKPLRIRFNKVDEITKTHVDIRYLELSNSYNEVYYRINSGIHNAILNKINYLINEKSGITDSINHNFTRIRIDSYNSSPIEKN